MLRKTFRQVIYLLSHRQKMIQIAIPLNVSLSRSAADSHYIVDKYYSYISDLCLV